MQVFQQDSVEPGSRFNFKKSGLVAATRASRAEVWRSGAQPSVGHGSGVAGTSDEALRQMRSEAALVVGAPARASNTPYLDCQCQLRYDPIFDATTSILCRLHCSIWDGRVPLSDVRHAWAELVPRVQAGLTWAGVRGPIAAAFFTLRRIGWDFASPHHWRDDQGVIYDLLQVAPADMKGFLEAGIMRW